MNKGVGGPKSEVFTIKDKMVSTTFYSPQPQIQALSKPFTLYINLPSSHHQDEIHHPHPPPSSRCERPSWSICLRPLIHDLGMSMRERRNTLLTSSFF